MIPYWLLLLFPSLLCLNRPRQAWSVGICIFLITFLSLFIGLRHEIGGDWFSYIPYVTRAKGVSFLDIINTYSDPGYNILNWLFAPFSWGIYGVNLFSTVIFSIGFVLFCRSQPRPWLALSISIPYLIIVVAMGYSRQAVALGFAMPALLALERGRLRLFLLLLACSASFHSTSLVLVGFIAPAIRGTSLINRLLRILVLLIVAAVLVHVFLVSNVDKYLTGYIENEYESEGALIRSLMNLVPAALFLISQKSFNLSSVQFHLWRSISIVSFICFGLLLLFPTQSTAIDRISLYLIPLQIFVGSRLPDTGFLQLSPKSLVVWLLVYCFLVQFVWLNFASHSYAWLPYQNLLFL